LAAAAPSRTVIFSSDLLSHGVVALDGATLSVLATIKTGGQPFDLAASPDGSTVYAAVIPANGSGSPSIAVINAGTLTIASTIPLPSTSYPVWANLSPDGSTLYVLSDGYGLGTAPDNSNALLVIDTASARLVRTVTGLNIGGRPYVSPDGTLLIFTDTATQLPNKMSAIDIATMSPAWSFSEASSSLFFIQGHPFGPPPPGVVFSPGGSMPTPSPPRMCRAPG